MAYTFKNRREAWDNIAAGSVTGQERHIAGAAGGSGDLNTTRHSLDGANVSGGELMQVQTTDAVWLGPVGINGPGPGAAIGGSGEVPGSTSNASFWTSTTSWTSKFPGNVISGASTS